MEFQIQRELGPHQVPNPKHRFHNRIVEIVDDRNLEPLLEQLDHRVGANEPRPAGHQNRLHF